MANYGAVNILRFQNDELQYSDDYVNWEAVTPDTITALPKPGELVVWIAGDNIDQITDIRLDSGTEIFAMPPMSMDGGSAWVGRVSSTALAGAEAKYDIFYSVGGIVKELDPKVKVEPPTP